MAVKLVKKAFGGELIFCVFINKGRKDDDFLWLWLYGNALPLIIGLHIKFNYQ